MFFLATMSTVTVVSNWSFRSFRNRLNQQEYAHSHPPPSFPRQPSGQYQAVAASQGHPGYDYASHLPQTTGHESKEGPLLLEPSRTIDFHRERSREGRNRMRTPSPAKRRNFM